MRGPVGAGVGGRPGAGLKLGTEGVAFSWPVSAGLIEGICEKRPRGTLIAERRAPRRLSPHGSRMTGRQSRTGGTAKRPSLSGRASLFLSRDSARPEGGAGEWPAPLPLEPDQAKRLAPHQGHVPARTSGGGAQGALHGGSLPPARRADHGPVSRLRAPRLYRSADCCWQTERVPEAPTTPAATPTSAGKTGSVRPSEVLRRPQPGRLFRLVKLASWIELGLFAILLVVWIAPGLEHETFYAGMAHGIGFIALALLIWIAVLRREAPYTLLAATLTPVGPLGSVIAIEWIERRGA